MIWSRRHALVMSIHLNSRGFAFALFEGPLAPCDWGVIEVRGKHRRQRLLGRIDALLTKYRPDLLVLQDTPRSGTARPHHIRRLNLEVIKAAERHGIPRMSITREKVRRHFSYLGEPTKDAIAMTIARHIPAFERFLPPPRKAWKSEHARMGMFDAAALALTAFALEETGSADSVKFR